MTRRDIIRAIWSRSEEKRGRENESEMKKNFISSTIGSKKPMMKVEHAKILENVLEVFRDFTIRLNICVQKIDIDAEVLGNHDFDDGIHGVVPYIRHPVIVSNIDDSSEPDFQETYKKSIIIGKNGMKIGIIGVSTVQCKNISNPGNLEFLPESSSVNEEAERLVKEEGVFTNIVLSHVGYEGDELMAKNASEKISLIVGENPPGPGIVEGPYPTIVPSEQGHSVLVVQASAFCRYLGNITIFLDQIGEIVEYSGEPIFLSKNVPQDVEIDTELLPWNVLVNEIGDEVVGFSEVKLSNDDCLTKECTLGDFADATIFGFSNSTTEISRRPVLSVVNSGGLRSSLGPGNITYGDLVNSQPFGNTIDIGEMKGEHIKEMFEFSLYHDFLQVSGFKVTYDLSRPVNNRVSSIQVHCQNCSIPAYEEINLDQSYQIAMCSYLSNGRGGYSMISENLRNKRVGRKDLDVFIDYLAKRSPVLQQGREGRIVKLPVDESKDRHI